MTIHCELAGLCAGCPWIEIPTSQQVQMKQESLRTYWKEEGMNASDLGDLPIQDLGLGGLRDRVDLTLHQEADGMRLGLYDRDHKHIVSMSQCPMMSPELARWFEVFKQHIPQIKLGGLRLRVAPNGDRGLWLHFPNLDINRFLRSGDWLRSMCDLAHLEVGQRRQMVRPSSNGLVLEDLNLLPWFETYLGDEAKPQPLFCSTSSFTQVGFVANRALVGRVRQLALSTGAQHWLELGAGIGNFSLPLAADGLAVRALENDPRAIASLRRSLEEAGLEKKVEVVQTNMYRKDSNLYNILRRSDAILADPPRSGLRSFFDALQRSRQRPQHFLYVSCAAKTLAADAARLIQMGYTLTQAEGLDHFPQSKHCEWLLLFQAKSKSGR